MCNGVVDGISGGRGFPPTLSQFWDDAKLLNGSTPPTRVRQESVPRDITLA